ncbi:hypothetical protein ONS96_001192 [Cadophora gregata f. sp. sojae]|nr:hypothetical protein ONS96_001192 [Cadophora gregata f. sp. sojae]
MRADLGGISGSVRRRQSHSDTTASSSTNMLNTFLTLFLFLGGTVGLKTVKKDVVIIGAGSSGVYTGIRLIDEGKDVAIIESSNFIGSHANTYYDPVTGNPINVGVQSFHNTTVVRDYFARLNVTATSYTYPQWPTVNVDFSTGKPATNYTSPSFPDIVAGFQAFRDVVAANYAYLDDGFHLPDPIPEELFLPFSEFAKKHGFEVILPSIAVFIQPVELWNEPTLYVIKNYGLQSIETYLGSLAGAGVFKPDDVNEIYTSAAEILGSRVILNSSVQKLKRSSTGVTLQVKTPQGVICIEASKVVMAAPPFLRNFAGWDLSSHDRNLFSKFIAKNSHIAITHNPTWNNTSYNGVGPQSTFGTPRLPGTVSMIPTGFTDSSYYSYVVFLENTPVETAQALFKKQVKTLIANGVAPASDNTIVEWFNHNYYMNHVPTADIRAGFYTKLNNLQGKSNTFYVGAAWAGQDSSMIWGVVDELLPKLLE